jgi:colanic acid biosynthesis glycosyl transferase WcaI
LVHDYGGYPFIVQLSRELARRNYEVLHLCAGGFRRAKGPMERRTDDPPSLSIASVTLNEPLMSGGWRRISQERRYARLLVERIESFRPQLVLSANSPLYVQAAAAAMAQTIGAANVIWLQDLHSVAISRITGRRIRFVGSLIGAWFRRLERQLLLESDGIVAISPAFLPVMTKWGIPRGKVEVIENWAPIDDTPGAKANAWSREHHLDDRRVLLYAGTLALKHNPQLLLELALGAPEAMVVVASEGSGADWLRAQHSRAENLVVLPFQRYEQLSDMLAAADVLVAVLEDDASIFSAPSKVLTYLAAGRPILAALPIDNPSARAIEAARAGTVVDPGDPHALASAARALLADTDRMTSLGQAARSYAQANFEIGPIADRFEAALVSAANLKSPFPVTVATDTDATVDLPHGTRN